MDVHESVSALDDSWSCKTEAASDIYLCVFIRKKISTFPLLIKKLVVYKCLLVTITVLHVCLANFLEPFWKLIGHKNLSFVYKCVMCLMFNSNKRHIRKVQGSKVPDTSESGKQRIWKWWLVESVEKSN